MRLLSGFDGFYAAMHAADLAHRVKLGHIAPQGGRRSPGRRHQFAQADNPMFARLTQYDLPSLALVHRKTKAHAFSRVNNHSLILHRKSSLRCKMLRETLLTMIELGHKLGHHVSRSGSMPSA